MLYQSPQYVVIKAAKTDKKAIMRFYKTQRYPASYIGQDQCYFIKTNNEIVACTMVSAGQENGEFWLLHALVTKKVYRGKGLARSLLSSITTEIEDLSLSAHSPLTYKKIICFADTKLEPLYTASGFSLHNTPVDIQQLPDEFQQRLSRYRTKQSDLCCYLYTQTT